LKGKRNLQDVYQSPEPSIEEDYQVLSERLVHLQKQVATAKKEEKGKQIMEEESTSPQYLRRSSRLKGKWRRTQVKGPHFIDLGGETPQKPQVGHNPPHPLPDIEANPSDVDESPSRPELEESPPPQQDFEASPRKTPGIDPK